MARSKSLTENIKSHYHAVIIGSGTEAGVIIFTDLVYVNPLRKKELQPNPELVADTQ